MDTVAVQITATDSEGRRVSSTVTRNLRFEIQADLNWIYTTLFFDEDTTVAVNLEEITAMYMPRPTFVPVTLTHVKLSVSGVEHSVPLHTPETYGYPGLFTLTGAVTITERVHNEALR